MFHQGDLQSGITAAIQQSKLVACFVRDESTESQTWEDEWLQEHAVSAHPVFHVESILTDEQVSNLLGGKAVVLRIQAGSQEAAFLSAFCPVERVPALVVIHNGQLRENLSVGVTHEEFARRVRAVLGADDEPEQPIQSITRPAAPDTIESACTPAPSEPPTSTQSTTAPSAHAATPPANSPAAPLPLSSDTASSPAGPSPVQSLLVERRQRLDTERQRAAEVEAAARRESARSRREAAEAEASSSASAPGPSGSAQLSYAAQQRQRIQQERRERERILAQIEADKAERREREARRREAVVATAAASEPGSTDASAGKRDETQPVRAAPRAPTASSSGAARGARPASAQCHLQLRLFDGSTVRHSFPRSATLSGAVRPWLDSSSPAAPLTAPYTFKHVLPPGAPRALSIADEEASLEELGLCPSATLVLVPVRGFTEAYSAAWGGPGWLGTAYGGLTGAYNMAYGGASAVAGALGAVLGVGGQAGRPPSGDARPGAGTSAGASEGEGDGASLQGQQARRTGRVNVRTLADQRAERGDERQFYNGNQLNFEPNRDLPGDEQ